MVMLTFCRACVVFFSLLRENAENMYHFSALALTLNEQEEGVGQTDSRLRPDQKLMEEGRWDEANSEKQRLEEKQRAVRRRREAEASDALDDGKRAGREARRRREGRVVKSGEFYCKRVWKNYAQEGDSLF